MSKSCASSITMLLILVTQLKNGALFFKANFWLYVLLFGSVTVIFPVTTIYASLQSHKSFLNCGVLNLTSLFVLYVLSDSS